MTFLLTRRWLLFFVAVVVLAYGCLWLGEWQKHRLEDREARNAVAREHLHMTPVPVGQVLTRTTTVPASAEWTRVSLTGVYQAADTAVVRYQTDDDGDMGVDVVTPLLQPDGVAVLVNRGWFRTDDVGNAVHHVPAPPAGTVTVVGWVRADGTGSSTRMQDHSMRAVSAKAFAKHVDYPMLQGFVGATSETPEAAHPLVPMEEPDLTNGPHFFYMLQWWTFGLIAVVGFGYLIYDERRKLRRGPEPPQATEPEPSALFK